MAPKSTREQEPGKQPSKKRSKKIFNIAQGTWNLKRNACIFEQKFRAEIWRSIEIRIMTFLAKEDGTFENKVNISYYEAASLTIDIKKFKKYEKCGG
jgi:hypothetical protein